MKPEGKENTLETVFKNQTLIHLNDDKRVPRKQDQLLQGATGEEQRLVALMVQEGHRE